MTDFINNCREYLDLSPYGLFIFDRNGRILEVNPEACHISGMSREALLLTDLYDLFFKRSTADGPVLYKKLISEDSSEGVVKFSRPDCSECSLMIKSVKVEDSRFLAYVNDVTEEKKTEENLKSRLRLEKIISAFSSKLTIVDSENIDQEINNALTLLGNETGVDRIYFFIYSDDLVFCSNLYEWCSEGTVPEIENLQNIKSSDFPWWTIKMKANEPIMFEDISKLPEDASVEKILLEQQFIKSIAIIPSFYNGSLKGFFGFDSVKSSRQWTSDDIHLLKMAGNSLCNSIIRIKKQQERDSLEDKINAVQRLDSIGKLAGGVAHDFNNIMQIIAGYTELALSVDNPAVKKYLDEIKKASSKASDLTGQLLAFARKQHVSPRSIDLNSAIEKTVSLLERLISPDINMDLKVSADLWPVVIDPSQVDQIITNLILNSADSIKGKGSIVIETYNTDIDEEYCRKHPYITPGKFAVITVSDTGCGMSDETKAHLFEPFYSTKKSSGSGLGLSTVYGIVKQNHGYIIAYSEENIGTTFKIYLNKGDPVSPVSPEAEDEASVPDVKNKNILVVEDEESILTLITRVLQKSDYKVVTAENGIDAVDEIEKNPLVFDLLITDVVMPGMNGQELDKKVREYYPEIKSIFMSGYTANIISDSGILEKGINFLQKPFSVKQLQDKVNEVLGS